MRIALCNEVVRGMDFAAQCAFAAEVGYDGIELAPFTLGDDPHLLDGAARAEVRRAALDAGIAITGLHWLLVTPAGLSITTADDLVRHRTVDVMRRLIGLCAELGGRVLVHGSPEQRRLEEGDEASGARRAIDCFAAIAEEAGNAGVVYCIEPLAARETNFVNTVAEAARIVDTIGSDAVRTMIDCSAASYGEDEPLPDLIDRWMPTGRIAHIQVNDENRRGPGEGMDLFAPVIAALKRNGYDDVVAVEPFVYKPDGPACAARAIGYIRGILEAQS